MAKKSTKKEVVEEEVKNVETVETEQVTTEQPTEQPIEEEAPATTEEEPVVESGPSEELAPEEPSPVVEEEIGETPYGPEEATIEKVEEAINDAEADFTVPENEGEQPVVLDDNLAEVNQVEKEFNDLKAEFDTEIEKAETPEQQEEIIKQEIKKAEGLKARAKKIIKSVDNAGFTSTWNGMSYDL